MWWCKRLSDAEFVERIRGNTPPRRKAGAIMLGTSLLMLGFVVYLWHMVTTGEWRFMDGPAEQQAFLFGALWGTAGAMALFAAAWWFILGFCMYIPDRREQLLLDYHRRLAELDQLPS